MNFFPKKNKAEQAAKYFHKAPYFYNCAQAVSKAFAKEYKVSKDQILNYAKFGGGRANEGQCGAYFAGMQLLKEQPLMAKEFSIRFEEKAKDIRCKEIKSKQKISCRNLVMLASEIIEDLHKNL
jgi:hypothetical protein